MPELYTFSIRTWYVDIGSKGPFTACLSGTYMSFLSLEEQLPVSQKLALHIAFSSSPQRWWTSMILSTDLQIPLHFLSNEAAQMLPARIFHSQSAGTVTSSGPNAWAYRKIHASSTSFFFKSIFILLKNKNLSAPYSWWRLYYNRPSSWSM